MSLTYPLDSSCQPPCELMLTSSRFEMQRSWSDLRTLGFQPLKLWSLSRSTISSAAITLGQVVMLESWETTAMLTVGASWHLLESCLYLPKKLLGQTGLSLALGLSRNSYLPAQCRAHCPH